MGKNNTMIVYIKTKTDQTKESKAKEEKYLKF